MENYNFRYSVQVDTNSPAVFAAVDGFVNQLKDNKQFPKDVKIKVNSGYAVIDETEKKES